MPLRISANTLGPLIALAVIGLLTVLLRRTFGAGGDSHPAMLRFARDDYGLLRAVAVADDEPTAARVRELLGAAGIRATVATGQDGRVRVLVFEDQIDAARRLVG